VREAGHAAARSQADATLGLLRDLMRLDRSISVREAVVLLLTGLNPGLSLSEIAWEMEEPPYAATRAVATLSRLGEAAVGEGLLRVVPCPRNRRIRQVFPTESGRRLLAARGIAPTGRRAA